MARSAVTTTKRIDLELLDAELGGHGLCGPSAEVLNAQQSKTITVAEGSPVTQAQLATAINAHSVPARRPTLDERVSALETKVFG